MYFRLHKTQFWTTASLLCSTTVLCSSAFTKLRFQRLLRRMPFHKHVHSHMQYGAHSSNMEQFSFNRKCKHRYVIWFPLPHHVQFHRSYMRRCSSIGNVSTFQVNIWRIHGVRTQPCDIWFPLLQHEQFNISCMRKCSSTGLLKHFYDIWLSLLQCWQLHLSCMSRTTIGHVSTVHEYIYIICVDEECAGTDIWHGSHYSNMGSFIVRACSYVMNPYTALLQCTKLSIDNFFFVMNRCSSNGNVSTVHELYTWYMYTYHYEKGARSHPYDMSSRAFVHARMWCTRVLYHFNVLSWPLAISFFVHEQMLFLNPWNPQLSYCCHVDDRLRFRCP